MNPNIVQEIEYTPAEEQAPLIIVPNNVPLLEEPKKECADCGEYFPKDAMNSVTGGRQVCEDCYSEYRQCDGCSDYFHTDTINCTRDDHYLCQDCWDTETRYCEDCDNTFYDGDTSFYEVGGGDKEVCRYCLDSYRQCSRCDRYFHEDYISYCDHCEIDYCEGCGHDCPSDVYREVRLTPQYGDKQGKYLSIKRLIGAEIECESGEAQFLQNDLPEACGIEEDGSLSSSGIEVTTPPASLNRAEEIITKACNVLFDAGYRIHSSCGLHVHIDAHDFKDDVVKTTQLFRTVYAIEDILISMLPPSRWHSQWCYRLPARYSFNEFVGVTERSNFDMKWYKHNDLDEIECDKGKKHDKEGTRYTGLNLHSLPFRGTVEFRYHSGSLDPAKILRWASLLLKIVNYAVKRYADGEIVALYEMPLSKEKLEKFFKIFRLSLEARNYVMARINKFNPDMRTV